MIPRTFRLSILAASLLASAFSHAANPDAAVVIREDAETATLTNGVVAAIIKKTDGKILSLKNRGVEMMSRGGGYWNIYGDTPGQKSTEQKGTPSVFRISQNPAENGGALGEIALRFPYTAQDRAVPLDIEIRYTLHRGDSGLYGWTITDHGAKYPPFNIEAGTFCMKVNPKVFDFLSVDARKQRLMPSPEDWVRGTQLNLSEARRMNTGVRKGEVEHKYDYAALFSQTPAWGWSSTKQHVGIFIVNPSIEYISGSAVRVDYGGHLDVKASLPADPTLLFSWHSLHYGGRKIPIGADEHWQKIVGPFLIYCNGADTPEAMWKDALARAAREQKAWPYAWAEAPGYEHAQQRGGVSGRLIVKDPQDKKANAAGAWVGLAAGPYEARFEKDGPLTIDWQTDGKHYQYWTRADAEGRFTIPNARPGSYVLTAFTDGVLGEFQRADVRVDAGRSADLGDLAWTPLRFGRQLWEIGIPNRSAEEFRHGDQYWQWGLYYLYAAEFPNDVDYVIGKSDYRRDWNYAQPPRPDPAHPPGTEGRSGRWLDTTWRIRFDTDKPLRGSATLRLSICGVRGGPVDVTLNGKPIGTTGELPDCGVMHRDGIRGTLIERDVKFDAALLTPGENVIGLTKHVRAWTDGVLYDYVRLELEEK